MNEESAPSISHLPKKWLHIFTPKRVLYVFVGIVVCAGIVSIYVYREPIYQSILGLFFEGPAKDAQNATYLIENTKVRLFDGQGHNGSIQLSLTGDPMTGDMNGDGNEDKIVTLKETIAGGFSQYVIAVAVSTPKGYIGSNVAPLGFGVTPKNVIYKDGMITAEYEMTLVPGVDTQTTTGSATFAYTDGSLDIAVPSEDTTSSYRTGRIGESMDFDNGATLIITKILADSRCPVNVSCVQAGTLEVEALLTESGRSKTVTLAFGKAITLNSGTVELSLVNATPDLLAGKTVTDSEYAFTISRTAIQN